MLVHCCCLTDLPPQSCLSFKHVAGGLSPPCLTCTLQPLSNRLQRTSCPESLTLLRQLLRHTSCPKSLSLPSIVYAVRVSVALCAPLWHEIDAINFAHWLMRQGASNNSGSSGHSSMEHSQSPSVSNSVGDLMRQSSTVSGEARNAPGALQVLKAAAVRAEQWKAAAAGPPAGLSFALTTLPCLCQSHVHPRPSGPLQLLLVAMSLPLHPQA